MNLLTKINNLLNNNFGRTYMTPKVLVVVWKPSLINTYNWNDPEILISQYVEDIIKASNWQVNYKLSTMTILKLEEYPVLENGFQFTDQTYDDTYKKKRIVTTPADYNKMLEKIKRYENIESFDEIWMFGAPYMGFYESRMIGKNPTFINSKGLKYDGKTKIIMGFSYERGVGEMLEDFCHRTEFFLKLCESYLYMGVVRDIGSTHTTPNSKKEYKWDDKSTILSNWRSWLKFPDYEVNMLPTNCSDWGDGDMRLHHIWWLSLIPKYCWKYVVDMSVYDEYRNLFFIRDFVARDKYKKLFDEVIRLTKGQ